MQTRHFIYLSYLGTHYHGWQIQPNADSVQGRLEKTFGILFKTSVAITGCGRTDTGVHARNYVAHADLDMDSLGFPPDQLVYKCNAILPADIVIHKIEAQATETHARFDALWRRYEYHLSFEKQVFQQGQVYQCPYPALDFETMNQAAQRLLQQEDFKCFAKAGGNTKHYRCTLMEAYWIETQPNYWVFHIKANRFLRNMVRAIVGTLIEIGRGQMSLQDLEKVLASGDRSAAGWSVPAEGLFLAEIVYS